MTKKKSSQAVYKKDGRIINKIKDGISRGVPMTQIYDSISHWTACPGRSQFYRLYKEEIAEARAEFAGWLGDHAKKRIEDGSDKILELALRSKAGWNPSVKIEEVDQDEADEDNDAMDILLEKLGKKSDAKDED